MPPKGAPVVLFDDDGNVMAPRRALNSCPEEHHTDATEVIISTAGGIIDAGDQVFIAAPGNGFKISVHEFILHNQASANGELNLDFATSNKVVARLFSSVTGSAIPGGRKHIEGGNNEPLTLTGTSLGNAKKNYVSVQYVIEPV